MSPFDTDLFDATGEVSQTEQAIQALRLYGPVFTNDEIDPRPMPEDHLLAGTVSDLFDALEVCFADTSMESDKDNLLWGLVNLFHRASDRLEQQLDDNVCAQQTAQRHQDGSEIKAVELERLIARGRDLDARQGVLETLRDLAADHFQRTTHDVWRPKAGSHINHHTLTAAMIDSRDYINARQTSRLNLLAPNGTKVAFSGGTDYQDVETIWTLLDRLLAKHTDLVLLNTASPTGADLIASKWAHARQVTEVTFKPDWQKHKRAAPFKRNDTLLDILPVGLVIFPGSGVQDNLADKAKALGIPVWRGG